MGAPVQDTLGPDAFRKLYPDQYYTRFLAEGLRPNGRPLGRARPTTIALGAISTADSSALVKIGNTTVMAGVKIEVRACALMEKLEKESVLLHLATCVPVKQFGLLSLPFKLLKREGKCLSLSYR